MLAQFSIGLKFGFAYKTFEDVIGMLFENMRMARSTKQIRFFAKITFVT